MDFALITVAYADIFDYPLTAEELSRWMIGRGSAVDPKKVQRRDGFYFLRGRSGTIRVRKGKSAWQQKKWDIARRASLMLSRIPTIQLVGVTGGLAMNNAGKDDDIDLYLIVKPGSLWTTRLAATLLMDIMGLRRHPDDISVANKICLNMFTSAPGVPAGERDLFTAHEVLQMEPVYDRGNIYKKFLQANKWVSRFLPNAWRYRYVY